MKIISLLLLSSLLSLNANSFYEPNARVLPLEKRFLVTSVTERSASESTKKLIGHMTLASISMDFKLKTSALDHLETARAEVTSLLKENSQNLQELNNLNFGKFTYDLGHAEKDYYLPVLFKDSVKGEIVDHSYGRGSKVEIKKSSIIQTSVKLNMKSTLELLTQTQKELLNNDYQKAQTSLGQIIDSALISETQVEDPVLTIWSNLVLSREFIDVKEYKSARFTLKKAQRSLKELEKMNILSQNKLEVKKLHDELDLITRDLDVKAPGLILKARTKTKEWINKVKMWI